MKFHLKILKYKLLWLSGHLYPPLMKKSFFKLKQEEYHLDFFKNYSSEEDGSAQMQEFHLSDEAQIKIYLKKQIPFVVRGGAKDLDIFRDWSFEYFEKEYGEKTQPVFISKSESSGVQHIKIKEIIRRIRSGEKEVNLLFGNLIFITKSLKEQMSHFFIKGHTRYKLGILKVDHFFMSGKGTFTPNHAEIGENLFIQVRGRKEWFVFKPSLASVFMAKIQHRFYFQSEQEYGNLEENKYIKRLPHYSVKLNEGDVLYNPCLHWHYVETHEDSISISCRWSNPLNVFRYPFLFFILLTARNPSVLNQFLNKKNTSPKDLY